MIKKDLSVIALVFFLTRCFFNLSTFNNLYSFLITATSIFIAILGLKLIKKDILSNKIIGVIYMIIIIYIFVNYSYQCHNVYKYILILDIIITLHRTVPNWNFIHNW